MLYATGILSDPWLGGKERFRLQPAILSQPQAERLRTAAERVGLIYHELSEIVIRHPELLDQFFNLTPWQKAMWLASEGRWHGIARVDLFICPDGAEGGHIRACEMNPTRRRARPKPRCSINCSTLFIRTRLTRMRGSMNGSGKCSRLRIGREPART